MTKILLGNHPYVFTEEEVAAWVESLGIPLSSVELIVEGATRNRRDFGFVTLRSAQTPNDAIVQLSE